jgi:hypothetical protein
VLCRRDSTVAGDRLAETERETLVPFVERPLPFVGRWLELDMLGPAEGKGVGRGVKLGRGDGADETVTTGSISSFSLAARRSRASDRETGCGMVSRELSAHGSCKRARGYLEGT